MLGSNPTCGIFYFVKLYISKLNLSQMNNISANKNLLIYKSIEITTYDLYFHENSPVSSTDYFNNYIATSGYDDTVRIWKIKINKMDSGNSYKTSVNSSIKIYYLEEFNGFKGIINCVRFCPLEYFKKIENLNNDCKLNNENIKYFIVGCADGGKVVINNSKKSFTIRNSDDDNAYDLCWVSENRILICFGSGNVELYEINFGENFVSKLICRQKIHNCPIQGISYNKKHNVFSTHCLDKTVKVHFIEELILDDVISIKFKKVSEITENIDVGMSVYRRLLISDDDLFVINKNKFLTVYSSPFLGVNKIKKIGPFNSSIIKILKIDKLLIIITKMSIYGLKHEKVFDEVKRHNKTFEDILFGVDNAAFKELTDGFVFENGNEKIIFYSSMDGFLGSIRLQE